MDICKYIEQGNFTQLIAIGDIHNHSTNLLAAIEYATANNCFIVFLGDLVDGMAHYPLETLCIVKGLIDQQRASFIIGNHDYRLYRYSLGNPVKLTDDLLDTFSKVNSCNVDQFMSTIQGIITHHMTSFYQYVDNAIFAHGSVHRSLWVRPAEVSKAHIASCIYGEVTGERDEKGFPVREYKWTNDVPAKCYAVIGHDRTALGKSHIAANTYKNEAGGVSVFTDTSCGKTVDGFLTGAVFTVHNKNVEFSQFIGFNGIESVS
jgi:hypothetical protein